MRCKPELMPGLILHGLAPYINQYCDSLAPQWIHILGQKSTAEVASVGGNKSYKTVAMYVWPKFLKTKHTLLLEM